MAVVSVEEIGLYRRGPDNDIDLQAVFGGRISGKKEKDLKVNPLYNDRNSVSQYSDINGNMSPVHVVTYESFPQTRTKNLPSENGNIKNGDVQQHTGENSSVNSNSGFHRNSAKTDSNHNIEGEANNKTVSSDSSNAPKLVHLQYQDLESGEEYSKLKYYDFDNSRKNTTDEKHVYNFSPQSENSIEQNSKGFRKDYSLLSYKNESFVLDEKDIVNIPKETEEIDVNTSKCREIQNSSGHEINSEPENKSDLVSEVDKNLVNPNSVQVNQSSVSNLTENTSLEKPNNNHLPESTYHELINVCDMQNLEHNDLTNTNDSSGNIQEELSDFGDSPQTCHKEILTEVLVHNAEPHESPRMLFHAGYSEGNSVCYSLDTEKNQIEIPLQADTSDWPDIDDLVRPVQGETLDRSETEIAQKTECRAMIKGHVRSVSDVIIQESEAEEDAEDKGDKCDVSDLDGSSLYKKKQTKKKSSSKAGVVSEANSSTRTLKSILSSTSSNHSCSIENDHKRQNSDSEIQELKTVKFSEDTVFNENKSNRYKKEKFGQINLRELYRGKIMSDEAVAKMNPLYQPEETVLDKVGGEEEQNSPTDNDKLTYELTLKNAMRLSKGKPGSLNGPSYLEQYLIMKAHGIKKDNVDIERLPETMEIPVYDRLIQRTLAKERRKICVKWSMVILTVAIITAVATTLGVYFKEGF